MNVVYTLQEYLLLCSGRRTVKFINIEMIADQINFVRAACLIGLAYRKETYPVRQACAAIIGAAKRNASCSSKRSF